MAAKAKKGRKMRSEEAPADGDDVQQTEETGVDDGPTSFRFKLLPGCGFHSEPGIGRVKPGETFESAVELDKKFRNKFERVGGPTATAPDGEDNYPLDNDDVMDRPLFRKAKKLAKVHVPARPQSSRKGVTLVAKKGGGFDEKVNAEEAAGDDLGDDVTDEFDGAEEGSYKVFFDADQKQWSVAEADDPAEAVGTFKSRKQVKQFLADAAQGGDESSDGGE